MYRKDGLRDPKIEPATAAFGLGDASEPNSIPLLHGSVSLERCPMGFESERGA